MKCSNCGKGIKEGNSFCTNCGAKVILIANNNDDENTVSEQIKQPLNENTDNILDKDSNVDSVEQDEIENMELKRKIPIAVKIIIPIFLILAIVVTIVLYNKSKDEETSIDEELEVTEEIEAYSVEFGVKYCYVDEYTSGYVKFNTENAFVMKMNYELEYVHYTGSYSINGNTITLTITYSSMAEDIEEFEGYSETLTILEDETIEWVTEVATYVFDKNVTIEEDDDEEFDAESLIEEIYEKYPNLKDTEGIICTDGLQCWLLDENGDKVYFEDMDSFESAVIQCNLDIDSISSTSGNVSSNSTTTNTTSANSNKTNTTSSSNSTTSSKKSKTMYIQFHRSCLINNFRDYIERDSNNKRVLTKELNVKVTANGETIWEDTLTNDDVLEIGDYCCTTSLITYTSTEAPTICVYVDNEIFRTYESYTTVDWFDSSEENPQYLGFDEHGAG